MKRLLSYRPGPAMLVTAAFIGPGTVTTATLAGANFGFALLWALIFATFATIILQSAVTRVALVTGMSLATAILSSFQSKYAKALTIILLLSALLVGNAAYEAGNISGAALGLDELIGSNKNSTFLTSPNIIGLFIIALLLLGNVKRITQFLITLVVIMSLSFIAIFFLSKPDMLAMAHGFIPRVPDGSILTVMALIGTTIVPYNLFLHASSVREKWNDPSALDEAITDNTISISLGGLVSIAILAASANIFFTHNIEISGLQDMAGQIEPIFGSYSAMALAIGLLAAGLTSALTAPLATAYIITEIWDSDDKALHTKRFKSIAIAIVLIGMSISYFQIKPIEIIFFAQIANGLLLPFVAIFLVKITADKKIMGSYSNNIFQNILSGLIVIISFAIGLRILLRATGLMP